MDFKAAPTNSSVVFKIADIKQAENESVLDYFSRGIDTIKDLKSKIDSASFVLADVTLTAPQALILATLTDDTGTAFENVSSILIQKSNSKEKPQHNNGDKNCCKAI